MPSLLAALLPVITDRPTLCRACWPPCYRSLQTDLLYAEPAGRLVTGHCRPAYSMPSLLGSLLPVITDRPTLCRACWVPLVSSPRTNFFITLFDRTATQKTVSECRLALFGRCRKRTSEPYMYYNICIYYSSRQHMKSQTEGNGENRVGRHRFNFTKCILLQSVVFVRELLCELQLSMGTPS
jgi:hypothetical protein